MPAIPGTRTVFPVLRRGRKRVAFRSRDSEDAAVSGTTSDSQHMTDKSRIDSHVDIQAGAAKCIRPTTTTVTADSTPAIETPAQHHPRRRHGLSRFPASLNPLRARKAAATPPQPPPATDLPLEECSICQDPIGVPNPEGLTESLVQLQCGHRFGQRCIITWVIDSLGRDYLANPSCPVCRRDIVHPCGHLIIPREPHISAAVNNDNEYEEGEGGLDDTAQDDVDAENEVAQRRGRRSSLLASATVGAKVAGVVGVILMRLVSVAMVRTITLGRRLSSRVRESGQAVCATEAPDEVQMMPPEGHCRICKEAAGEKDEDDEEPPAE